MPDQRSVMKEFRFLDAKRSAGGLTPTEELRYTELRDLVTPEHGDGGAPLGFDVDAAAARLRESLLPAGLRNRPPPTPVAEPEPEPEPAADVADALPADDAPAFGAQHVAVEGSEPEGLFDPASLDAGTGATPWDPNAEAYDPAQPYDPNAQAYDPAQPYDPNAQAYDPAQPYDPNAQAYDPAQPYDPNALAYDPAQPYDPNALAYDPAQPYDPSALAYDPAQPYDPNALAYDPAQPYDPNAQAYYPAQPYDPNAQAHDPAQPYDPDAQAYYPAQPYDPNAQAHDPAQPYDPDAQAYYPAPPYDASADSHDTIQPFVNAEAHDPAQPYDTSAEPYYPAQPYDASADSHDTTQPFMNAEAHDPALPYAPPYHASQPWDVSAAACEASLPNDPGEQLDAAYPPMALAAELHEAALGEPGGFELEPSPADAAVPSSDVDASSTPPLELEDPTFAPVELAPPAAIEAGELSGFASDTGEELSPEPAWAVAAGALRADPLAAAGDGLEPGAWDDEGSPSVEAAAEPLVEGELAPLPQGEFLSDEEPEAAPFHSDASPLPPAGWEVDPPRPAPAAVEAFGDYDDETGGSALPAGADAGLESMLPLDPAASAPASEDVREGFGTALGEYDDTAAFAAPYPYPEPPDLANDPSGFQAAQALEPAEHGGWEPDLALEAVPLDGGLRLESGGSFDALAPIGEGAAAALALPPERGAAEPSLAPGAAPELEGFDVDDFSVDVDEDTLRVDAAAPAELALEGDEEIPTIDGDGLLEEIVEEAPEERAVRLPEPLDLLPPPAPEPPRQADAVPLDPGPEPEPEPAPVAGEPQAEAVAESRIAGVHRVVVHTVEGQVRRGVLEDADLEAATLALLPQPGAAPEWIETETVKAIFFMLGAGERPPAPEGKRVRVSFADGRQVAGFSPDYREDRGGFFMIPADTRTNTGRIWVYRAAARQVTVS